MLQRQRGEFLARSSWCCMWWTTQSRWQVGQLREHMTRRGYLTQTGFGARMRNGGLPIALVGALGTVRYLAGMFGGRPVEYLGIALLVVGFFWWVITRSGPTSLGNGARRRIESRHQHLDPKHAPTYETYGPMAAAMAVAVFAAVALAEVDPGLADTMKADQGSGGSGGDGGSGGSCGGCGG